MKIMKKVLTLFTLIALIGASTVSAQSLKVDVKNSTLNWTGKKIAGSHTGTIALKEGTMMVENNRITKGNFVIDMTTLVDTDLQGEWKEKLEGHLRSDDFFSVEKFKTSVLEVTKASEFTSGSAEVEGKLTIKGMTHPVKFSVMKDGSSYMASVKVDRTLYDIKYGSGKFFSNLGDNMIDDYFVLDVKIVTSK